MGPEPIDVYRPADVAEWGDRIVLWEGMSAADIRRLYPELSADDVERYAAACARPVRD